LDLFAGTGQVGIEALSRGATAAVFIDLAKEAIRVIRENLEHTNLMSAGVQILHRDAFAYLHGKMVRPFDVVFVAPPQYKGLWKEVLLALDLKPDTFITEDGMVIVQIDPKEFEELSLKRLILFDKRKYGRTMLCFYEISDSIIN
jgi:16S rRNA (guanine(966)-N(2))-methyltransferase RsmD